MPVFFHFTKDRMYICCTFMSEIKDYYYYNQVQCLEAMSKTELVMLRLMD